MKNVNVSDRLILVCKKMIELDPSISYLELNKKLYFIHAALLTEFNIEAFPEDFIAWMYGPAVAVLNEKYRFINDLKKYVTEFKTAEALDETVKEVIDIIMEEFKDDSAKELVNRSRSYKCFLDNIGSIIPKKEIVKCHKELREKEGLVL